MKRIIFYILTALMAQAMLTACSHPQWGWLQTTKERVQAPTETPSPDRSQIHRSLNEQDYAGALAFIQQEIHKGANEQNLSREYLQAVNGGLNQARSQMKQGAFSKAARLLKTVRDNYPRSPEQQKLVVATPAQITTDIDLCTQNLMAEGLVAYRAGALATALGLWQQILAVDPRHQAAKNASETTQQQLIKLKTLNDKS